METTYRWDVLWYVPTPRQRWKLAYRAARVAARARA